MTRLRLLSTLARRLPLAGQCQWHAIPTTFRPSRGYASVSPGRIGQPTPETHPHLLKHGEITPGIARDEFKARRARLVSRIEENGVVIVPGYGLRYATNGIFHQFHQSTDLLYLCGIDEPDCALVLEKTTAGHKMILFVRPRDKSREMWDGPRAGFDGAVHFFGADEAKPIDTLPAYIDALASSSRPIYTDLAVNPPGPSVLDSTHIHVNDTKTHASSAPPIDRSITNVIQRNVFGTTTRNNSTRRVNPLGSLLAEQRLNKSPAEVAIMRQAGRITGRAFVQMMRETKPGVGEHDLWAVAEHSVKRQGASRLAYVPVVAGGENALTIHYVLNDQLLTDGAVVLVDAGGEYGGYASDVTRTWPVNGKFTKEQRELYEIVLRTQRACIAKCTGDEGANISLDDLQREAFDMLRAECSTLFGRAVTNKEMNTLYPHHVGHWLGLDVHDTSSIRRTTTLKSGMVVTIEPALYIPHGDTRYPPGYRGTAIRIEDDVVVGGKETGYAPIVLSVEAPKEVDDVEAVMAGLV
ncbi:hypothetical protein PhCBS80983_g05807 [Powellomyces hirtus]|uniref:Aminopeptidase P N-terminal domain-containing protein n=1 Tax=Powellomyces hirtus TaxID=109895 RepID=A0A507DSK0_9FUNG|nr:hypothetical protein PhCBS80983_g05807 [Powellomyces hirtus]